MVKIAPSTDPISSLKELKAYIKEIEDVAHFLHIDVMDGNFVERKTFDESVVSEINACTTLMLDVHLMVKTPDIKKYIDAGANIITVHYEAYKNLKELKKALKSIRKNKALAGVSIKPSTDIEVIKPILPLCDLVLIMSVEPGRSGQKFLESTYEKIKNLKKKLGDNHIQIEVDGGVNAENSKKLALSGADILVSGSYIYNSKSRQKAIKDLM